MINNDYNWSMCTNQWLLDNVKPFIDSAPEFYKLSKINMQRKLLEFIHPSANDDIKLYGYYSAYDHVCFAQIFGKMINLPERITNVYNRSKTIFRLFRY